jgi:tRNA(Ile)-lysidine synthase
MASSRKRRSAEPTAHPIDAAVAEALARHVRSGETVTVALSGGVDSVVLLDAVRRLAPPAGIRVRALHVNHALSPNAATWQRFCEQHCRRRGIAFEAVPVEVRGAGANVEAEARRVRYQVFATHGSEVVALAHSLDDQAETVLLNLLRGAGVRGLAAMPALRSYTASARARGQRLLRPLLDCTRQQILEHASRRRLRWVEDESNANDRYTRNFLRRRVLPLIERRFPAAKANLARAAAHLQEAAAVLDSLAAADCAAAASNGRIKVEALKAMSRARAVNALRFFLAECGERPLDSVRTGEALRQLTEARRDAQPQVTVGRGVLARHQGWIEWRPHPSGDAMTSARPWRGESPIALGAAGTVLALRTRGEGVSAARLRGAEVTLRRRQGGERIRIDPLRPTRTLKNLLQEARIPPWERARMPLLYCGEQLVWVPGVGVAAEYRARAGEPAWRFHWQPSPDACGAA